MTHRSARRRTRLPAVAALAAVTALVGLGCELDVVDDDASFDRLVPTPAPPAACTPPETHGGDVGTPSPTVELPPEGTGNPFFQGTSFAPADVGYRLTELFFAGDALAMTAEPPLDVDGQWASAYSDSEAAFESRLLVFRPIDPSAFSGTVFVEWLNVSGGLDAAPDWTQGHVEMIRQGHAWVGVSAQLVGIEGGGGLLPGLDLGLKSVNPGRYGELLHPGDSFSYDIFSQAGQAVRFPTGLDPLDGLEPERVIALGESQSAMRLVTYVNAVDPIARVYDAFLIHSRLGSSVPLSQDPEPPIATPVGTRIREDARVPVLVVQTETDVVSLSSYRARRDDGPLYRLWEIAGTAHADGYGLRLGFADVGGDVNTARVLENARPIPGIIECDLPVNGNPAHHFVYKAALRAMHEWVACGVAPPVADRLRLEAGPPVAFQRDGVGNVLGGIRTPYVDAPIAELSGDGNGGSCFLFGTTRLFDTDELSALYPDTDTYRSQVQTSLDAAVDAGFILEDDAPLIEAAADEIVIVP